MQVDYLIIGGGIAGVTAAEEIRAHDASGTILIIGDEPMLTYSRVMLPHVIRGKIPEERAFLRTDTGLLKKAIEFKSGVSVVVVDVTARTVRCSDDKEIGYGKLLFATGGHARRLVCPGGDDPKCLSFQTMDDARSILSNKGARKAVVVGGGFIALELLMTFASYGAKTVAIVRGEGFFSRILGEAARKRVDEAVAAAGVEIRIKETVCDIMRDGEALVVGLSSGGKETTDVVGVGIGLEPNTDCVPTQLLADGNVAVNDRLETAVPGVFAAGDVAAFEDGKLGRRRNVGNWQNAIFQAKVAGANMAGGDETFDALTAYTIACFGMPLAFIGVLEEGSRRIVREEEQATVEWHVEREAVVGAAIVGLSGSRAAVQRIVTLGLAITPEVERALGDPNSDLAQLA